VERKRIKEQKKKKKERNICLWFMYVKIKIKRRRILKNKRAKRGNHYVYETLLRKGDKKINQISKPKDKGQSQMTLI
jgi:hypothetical protein